MLAHDEGLHGEDLEEFYRVLRNTRRLLYMHATTWRDARGSEDAWISWAVESPSTHMLSGREIEAIASLVWGRWGHE